MIYVMSWTRFYSFSKNANLDVCGCSEFKYD
uniref:Uncharacterized protein n=1 Tax=Anguilla anguilla TaxID=7936 RepID=A0A0E9VFY9_ANGAN